MLLHAAHKMLAWRTALLLLVSYVGWNEVTGNSIISDADFGVVFTELQDLQDLLTGVIEKRNVAFPCRKYQKIGCFDKRKSPMVNMTFLMDNLNGNETMKHDLICLCSAISSDLKNRYFAMSNNECYFGNVAPTANKDTSSSCKDAADVSKACGSGKCMGKGNGTYVYQNSIDGVYTLWGAWSACSATCGNQNQVRKRTCTDPAPFGGGSQCVGSDTETKACPAKPVCIVAIGVYSAWKSAGACNVKCGTGRKPFIRTCTPGKDCSKLGPSKTTVHCFIKKCPVACNDYKCSYWGKSWWSKSTYKMVAKTKCFTEAGRMACPKLCDAC